MYYYIKMLSVIEEVTNDKNKQTASTETPKF